MTTSEIISLLIAGGALFVAYLTFRRSQHGDTATSAAERASMSADLRYIRTSIDEIKLEYKAIQRDVVDIRERLIKVEQSTKSAHNRLDDIQAGRI